MAFSRHTSKDVAGYNKKINLLEWNSEGNYLGMVSSDKCVKIGQLDKNGSFQNVHNIPNSSQMTQICWNPADDSRIAMCGDDKFVELWDVRASRASAKLPASTINLSLAWSPCGTYIAVGNKSDLVSVLDLRTGTVLKKKKFNYEVNELAWTANPLFLLAANAGHELGCVDVIGLGDNCTDTSMSNNYNKDSNSSTSSGANGNNTANIGELTVVDSICAHVRNCITIKTDASCRRLAVGSLDQFVSFWDLDSMVCLRTTEVGPDVRSLSFSGDGRYLAVVGEDPSILICDTDSGEAVSQVPCRHKLNALSWHPKRQLLALAVDDRSPSPQFLRFLAFPQC